jgi:hypothetical protein
MNALDRFFMNVGQSSKPAQVLGVVAATALLSGCVGGRIASVQVDPNSPVAPEVARMARASTTYPSFSDIPPEPTDVRPPQQFGERARQLLAERDRLIAATAPQTWTLGNTQAFVNQVRSAAGPNYQPPASSTEAFANTVRKRATPPPSTNP